MHDGLRILLPVYGSLGDLHPFLALAAALREAGHSPVIASHPDHRERVLRTGTPFVPIPPGPADVGPKESFSRQANDPRHGLEYVIRRLLLPHVGASHAALVAAARGCDLLIAHPLAFAVPTVAEQLAIPWLSVALQPAVFFSAHDPPVLSAMPALARLRFLGAAFHRLLFSLIRRHTTPWFRPLRELRHRLGLPAAAANPLFDGFSPFGTLALFPPFFGPAQSDWPPHVTHTGFPLRGYGDDDGLSPALQAFLAGGADPVVFTLGSGIVLDGLSFFRMACAAVGATGHRAVVLAGPWAETLASELRDSPHVHVCGYAASQTLFPRAAAIVHHCGIGNTGHALRAGRPQVMIPFAFDQTDNAARLRALGCGVVLRANGLDAARLAGALRRVTRSTEVARRCAQLAASVAVDSFQPRVEDAIGDALARLRAQTVIRPV